uniref:Uncharacterized protein n=1 Tax=Lotus japonicus TaxID=34305 RepID=I3T187_LOTJA|nr:unknown [Lotus japonicus]
MFIVDLLTLRNTPLKICLNLNSCKILLVLGCRGLIPWMRIINKSLASGST